MSDLPPLPRGAVPLSSDLPPLPKGAVAIGGSEWDSDTPIQPMPSPKNKGFANQVIENLPKELFATPHPAAQIAVGALKPFAGLAEYGGITAPAEVLNQLSQRFEEGSSPTAAKALDITGQILPMGAGAKAISQLPQLGQYLPQAVNTIKNVVQSSPVLNYGLQGAGQAALTPVTTPENADQSYMKMLEQKIENMGIGAGLGAVLGKGSQMLMNPMVSDKIKAIKDFGVKSLTPGQLMGFPEFEKKMTSLPISGWLINKELESVNKEMNRAVANKALSNMGEQLPKDVKAGTDMMEHLQNKVNTSYDKIANKISFVPSRETIPNLNKAAMDASKELTPAEKLEFNEIIKDQFFSPLIGEGSNYKLNGQQFRAIESTLGAMANRLSSSADAKQRGVGFALFDFQQALRQELAKLNPAHAKELQGIHNFFKDYLRINRAAGSVGAVGNRNVFNPQQLLSASNAMSSAKQKGSSSGIMTKEAQDIQDVLGKTVPDSGTASRVGVMGALADLAAHGLSGLTSNSLTGLTVPAIVTGAVYNPLSRKLINSVAGAERPEAIKAMQPQVSGALSQIGGVMGSRPSVQVFDPATGEPVTQQQPYATPQ